MTWRPLHSLLRPDFSLLLLTTWYCSNSRGGSPKSLKYKSQANIGVVHIYKQYVFYTLALILWNHIHGRTFLLILYLIHTFWYSFEEKRWAIIIFVLSLSFMLISNLNPFNSLRSGGFARMGRFLTPYWRHKSIVYLKKIWMPVVNFHWCPWTLKVFNIQL